MVFNLSPPFAAYAALTRSCGVAAFAVRARDQISVRPAAAQMAASQHNHTARDTFAFRVRMDVPPYVLTSAQGRISTRFYRKKRQEREAYAGLSAGVKRGILLPTQNPIERYSGKPISEACSTMRRSPIPVWPCSMASRITASA